MTEQGGYPPPDHPDQPGPPADQPSPSGPEPARPSQPGPTPGQPTQAEPPSGQAGRAAPPPPQAGPPYQPWPPPGQAHQGDPAGTRLGPVPPNWPAGDAGLAYPQPPADDQGRHQKERGAVYVLAALGAAAVVSIAAAFYWLPTRATPAPAYTAAAAPAPTEVSAPTAAPAPAPARQHLTVGQLRTGDCLEAPLGLASNNPWPPLVTAVTCTDKHLAEVFFEANHFWPAAMAYPGNTAIAHRGRAQCSQAFRAYVGIANSASIYEFEFIVPGRPEWQGGERLLACVAFLPSKRHPGGLPLSGSMKGADS
jgi:hypothetical protein